MFNFLEIFFKSKYKSTKQFQVIDNFNVEKFVGRWYEIARYDHFFEKYQINVYTEYSLKNDKIIIKNFGQKENKLVKITGIGKFKYKNLKNIGWLRISFFKPFYNDYKILYVDEDYNYMIITGSSTKYFWILSRNKNIDENTLSILLAKSEKLSFIKSEMIFN